MQIDFTPKQFRRLLDMVYIGNWVLNSIRGVERIEDYDVVESYLFGKSRDFKMNDLSESIGNMHVPSRAFVRGGIHYAISEYEDVVFFEILAQELAYRDFVAQAKENGECDFAARMKAYITEFEKNGIENLILDAEI